VIVENTDIWQAFGRARLCWKDKSDVLKLARPIHIITAYNPHGRRHSKFYNWLAHYLLRLYLFLRFPRAKVVEMIGHSECESWQEVSYAVNGLTLVQALGIAKLFCQLAIFAIDETVEVIPT
jgi:hypothetical protein